MASEYGYDVYIHKEVIPKPPPTIWKWIIGPVMEKIHDFEPGTTKAPFSESEITVQLTADQQVELTIKGEDRYGNAVEIGGDVVWQSSDDGIIAVTSSSPESATASAVGTAGTASVTVTNDADRDGTGDFMGSLAIDVVAGDMAEIVIEAGEPTDKA